MLDKSLPIDATLVEILNSWWLHNFFKCWIRQVLYLSICRSYHCPVNFTLWCNISRNFDLLVVTWYFQMQNHWLELRQVLYCTIIDPRTVRFTSISDKSSPFDATLVKNLNSWWLHDIIKCRIIDWNFDKCCITLFVDPRTFGFPLCRTKASPLMQP